MKLFVLRHGRAEPHRTDDASRALLDSGRADVRAIVSRQAPLLGRPLIWSSPYVRARQTAEIAADVLGLRGHTIFTTENLVPEARLIALVEEIYRADVPSLLLASHQPLVSALLDHLCGPSEAHAMKTSALACVSLDVVAADLGRLEWLLAP